MAQKKKAQDGSGAAAGTTKSAQAKAQDHQVMATNNSSIVSKRSVEKLYYPDEAHFFRFFVKKFQRRAPLINRGYHFRLHVIDVLVRDFLRERGMGEGGRKGKRKVVINLGCGSDVLPWQCLTRYPESCQDVKFVDVDFPDLIERKRQTVEATPELKGAFTGVKTPGELGAPVMFESDQYVQIGCDLRQLDTLRKGLDAVLDVQNCEFLFVAEVSITYMETEGADGVIQWASALGDAQFVLLEQILPEGAEHPFAATMLSHFQKLNTPLKSVHTYSTLNSQLERFSSRGWKSVLAWTLWQAWADETFLRHEERRKLDAVEPFDEWEEFAIFGSHYCIIHAKTQPGDVKIAGTRDVSSHDALSRGLPYEKLDVRFDECLGQRGQRRFAAAMLLPQGNEEKGSNRVVIVNTLGLGTKSRLQSCDVYSRGDSTAARELTFGDGGPVTRMCHTLTDLGGDFGVLLAGGRASPTDAFKDCWVFNKSTNNWTRAQDLPVPLYRHSVTSLGHSGMALLAGGAGSSAELFGDLLVYSPEAGWANCEVSGDTKPLAVCGAILASRGVKKGGDESFHGLFAGGIRDGLVARQMLAWELNVSDKKKPTIRFKSLITTDKRVDEFYHHTLERFGATACWDGEAYRVLGGVIRDKLLPISLEILRLPDVENGLENIKGFEYSGISEGNTPPRPLLIGTSIVSLSQGSFIVMGGGATCFSMGTFWNKSVYTFQPAKFTTGGELLPSDNTVSLVHEKAVDIIPGERSIPLRPKPEIEGGSDGKLQIKTIPRVKLHTPEEFTALLRKGQPAVIEGLDLGSCVSAWNLEYLTDKVGTNQKVVIHDSSAQAMDFYAKNFRYVTTSFEDFAQRVGKGDKLYLRALSEEKPAEKPASLADDFPNLAPDFVLPPQLLQVTDNLFSSVLRVSGPVNMWLHYDVMANVYCQIHGSKRFILFPPSDVQHLSFAPGASSSSIDVFSSLSSPILLPTHPQEATLLPGDVLFLPPLWLHTATPASSESSIAVNVFFRDFEGSCYAAGRDVYGNRDIAAYEKGRLDVARIAASFGKVSPEVRGFYLLRLAEELRRKAGG